MISVIIVVLLTATGTGTVHASPDRIKESNIINWAQLDFPPYIIMKGKFKGKGIDDQVSEDIMENLSGYKHNLITSNIQRILQMFKDKEQVVTTPLFKTPEREPFVLYSDVASYLVLPNYFVIRKEDKAKYLPYLSKNGTLDIEKVLLSENLSVGINLGRAYGGIIDEMIKKYKDSGKFYLKTSANLSESMINMLHAKRIDATFEFPATVKYICEEEGSDFAGRFETISVNGMVPYIPIYFAAPHSDWGEKIMNKVNLFLKQPGTIAKFVTYYEGWLDESDRQRYEKVLEMYYAEKYPEIYKTLIP